MRPANAGSTLRSNQPGMEDFSVDEQAAACQEVFGTLARKTNHRAQLTDR